MAFVLTDGQVSATGRSSAVSITNRLSLSDGVTQTYQELWKRQPQIRTVVSFLGRNIAQIGLQLFERLSDVDRRRVLDHPAAELMAAPNPFTTPYRMLDALVQDMGIWDNSFWLKATVDGSTKALFRIPPTHITPLEGNWMFVQKYRIGSGTGAKDVDADQIVHFRGYNPEDSRWGASPMESLRRILAEEYEAGLAREQLWKNGARFPGYLTRPKTSGDWSDEARKQFMLDWADAYTGRGAGAGGTPILEDDMDYKASGITPSDAQYLEARKLTREEVASAYHIPLPMVGILDHATFSNIKEQHQQLYQDTLGPWLKMIEQDIKLQLLGDFTDQRQVYFEFNLQEKMRGSFEEQASNLQTSVGAPWLTRNEARARLNLPQIDGGDELVTPMNLVVGGQPAPADAGPKARRPLMKSRPSTGQDREAHKMFQAFFRRQRSAVLSALGSKAAQQWWDGQRWDKELAEDILALSLKSSEKIARATLTGYGQDPDLYDTDQTEAFLAAVADKRAAMVNATTKDLLDVALLDEEADPADVFDYAEDSRAETAGATLMTTIAGFATTEAGKQVSGGKATKTWSVSSSNPRPSHAALDGETVPISEPFSNGAQWPGDSSALDVDDVAGCTCDVTLNFP